MQAFRRARYGLHAPNDAHSAACGTAFALSPSSPRTLRRHTSEMTMKKFGYLIDMDGVIYRGSALIPGADRFVNNLKSTGTPFLFLTNNSQRTRRDVQMRLR